MRFIWVKIVPSVVSGRCTSVSSGKYGASFSSGSLFSQNPDCRTGCSTWDFHSRNIFRMFPMFLSTEFKYLKQIQTSQKGWKTP
ncbi:hypothetical protein O3P69_001292 [Scylla paramamosain]|uniref:Secreted protein n=1 Tax=Scylla paramamosain TaxID=85552 RepID=A0AAW0USC4_SCYPA